MVIKKQRMNESQYYSSDEIKEYMSEIRLLVTEDTINVSDTKSLNKIEQYVFSQSKAESCSYNENLRLISRLFLSLRREMDILQPYVEDDSITEIMVNGKDNIFVERRGIIQKLNLSFDNTEA